MVNTVIHKGHVLDRTVGKETGAIFLGCWIYRNLVLLQYPLAYLVVANPRFVPHVDAFRVYLVQVELVQVAIEGDVACRDVGPPCIADVTDNAVNKLFREILFEHRYQAGRRVRHILEDCLNMLVKISVTNCLPLVKVVETELVERKRY